MSLVWLSKIKYFVAKMSTVPTYPHVGISWDGQNESTLLSACEEMQLCKILVSDWKMNTVLLSLSKNLAIDIKTDTIICEH